MKYLRLLGYIFCVLFSLPTWALQSSALFSQLSSLLKPYKNKAALSIRDAQGKEIYEYRGSELMAPASVAKLVSTGCALQSLEAPYEFETPFGYTGKINASELQGDLVIQGSGDPSFVIENLREVVDKIVHLYGIREWTGKLIFDVHYFGVKSLDIGEGFSGDSGRAFTALLTATAFNFNAFSAWTLADPRGSKTLSSILPNDSVDIQIQNQSKWNSSHPELNSTQIDYDPKKHSIHFGGEVGKDSEPKAFYRSVEDPYSYYFRSFRNLTTELGIHWKNPAFDISYTEVKAKTLVTHKSRTLSRLLMDVNKSSLNFGAELLLLAAGAEKYGKPATPEKSKKLLGECLSQLSISSKDIQMDNASGLSRQSKLKASALTQFLRRYSEETYFPEYLSSLSLLGKDGSAKKKLGSFKSSKGRVKTGSLKDVRSLAGILYPASNLEPLYFALFFNELSPSDPKVQDTESELLHLILK